MKVCTACGQQLPIANFCNKAKSKDGKNWECRSCANDRRIKERYDMSPEEYQLLSEKQSGRCLICGAQATCIDHDHRTGKVRGLLCRACNLAIGLIQDSPARARQMADYLSTP